MDKIKCLKITNVREINEATIAFNLEEEEVTAKQIFKEYEKVIADFVDKGILKPVKT